MVRPRLLAALCSCPDVHKVVHAAKEVRMQMKQQLLCPCHSYAVQGMGFREWPNLRVFLEDVNMQVMNRAVV